MDFGLLHLDASAAGSGRVQHHPAVAVHADAIVNTNGAGDSFVGAAAAALGSGMGIDAAIQAGLAAAHLSVQSETAVSDSLTSQCLVQRQ